MSTACVLPGLETADAPVYTGAYGGRYVAEPSADIPARPARADVLASEVTEIVSTPETADDARCAVIDSDAYWLSDEESAWRQNSHHLVDWSRQLVVRWSRHGRYWRKSKRTPVRKSYTSNKRLTLRRLKWHFCGGADGDVVGILFIKRDRHGRCWSKCVAVDIDRHNDTVDPAVTLAYAKLLYERAKQLGFKPLLLDSNGNGGYHLWLQFDRDVRTQDAYNFGRWFVRDYKEHGLKNIEAFPKQPGIGDDPKACGNWLRLPGRHHTRDHWSKVWDGSTWLAGSEAIEVILATTGVTPTDIPPESLNGDCQPPKAGAVSSEDFEATAQVATDADLQRNSRSADKTPQAKAHATESTITARARYTGDADLLTERLIRDVPIPEVGTRHDLMVPEVASAVRRGYDDETIIAAFVAWHAYYYALGRTAKTPEVHLVDLRHCLAHTRSQPRFAPTAVDGHGVSDLNTIIGLSLSPALEEALRIHPPPVARKRLAGKNQVSHSESMPGSLVEEEGVGQTGGEKTRQETAQAHRILRVTPSSNCLCDSLQGPQLVESENDQWFVEAIVRFASAHVRPGRPAFFMTDEQIRQVIMACHGVRWNNEQILRRKVRYISRLKGVDSHAPAEHVELLREESRGSGAPGGKRKSSRYVPSPLLVTLIDLGVGNPSNATDSATA